MADQSGFVPAHPWLRDGGRPLAISHEGVRNHDEPITIDGFVAAFDMGFRHMETDIRLLASGQLVAFHEVAGSVEETSLDELRHEHGPVPTVDQLLVEPSLRGVKWNFELKGGDARTAQALTTALGSIPDPHRVCVSFGMVVRPAEVDAIRDALPAEVCLCASLLERSIDWGIFGGLLRSANIDARVTCTQVASEPLPGAAVLQVGEADVRQAHERGLAIHVYDILRRRTDALDVERLLDIGVDGIITDDHEVVRQVFIERGLWPHVDHGRQPIGTLGVLALDCPDALALAGFYRQLIGGDLVEHSGGDWIELRTAKGTVAFQQISDHRRPTWPGGDTPQQAHIDIDVDDLDHSEAKAVAIGAIKASVQPSPDAFRVFIDPAGHPFCLVLPWKESPPRADPPG